MPSRERARLPAPAPPNVFHPAVVRPNLSDWTLPPPDVSQKTTSEPRSAENFGLAEPSPERAPERAPIEIVATVTELRQTVPNAYVITLDNGQVWRQAHPMPYPLRPGLVVRLRETTFGYRLSAPELHGQINVERVR